MPMSWPIAMFVAVQGAISWTGTLPSIVICLPLFFDLLKVDELLEESEAFLLFPTQARQFRLELVEVFLPARHVSGEIFRIDAAVVGGRVHGAEGQRRQGGRTEGH